MKLLLPCSIDDDDFGYESVWVTPVEDGYRIDNIPFLAKSIAWGDVVSAEEKDGFLYYEDLVRASGHSTVRILFEGTALIKQTEQELEALGCSWEESHIEELLAVDIPPTVDYGVVEKYLIVGKAAGNWGYQEACLGFID